MNVYSLFTEGPEAQDLSPDQGLLLLVSVLSQTLLTLVRCHFVLLSFLTAWHSVFNFCTPSFREVMTRL